MRWYLLGGVCGILLGCGGNADSPSWKHAADGPTAPMVAAPPAVPQDPAGKLLALAQINEQPGNPQPPGQHEAPRRERKIIYTAHVVLVVEDFREFERELPPLVTQAAGYLADVAVDRTHGDQPTGRWTVRVPVDKFESFLERLEGLGVAEHRQQTAQEVTEEFVDLQSRITNKRRLEERILKLLESHSGKINDVIEVERELGRVREEIERMEGRLRLLSDRTALATINLTVREERDYVPPQAPTFAARVAKTWGDSLLALRRFAESVAITAVAAAPWLVVAIPLGWLCRMVWKRTRKAGTRSANHPSVA